MSLRLAHSWITAAFHGPHSARDAMNGFEKAAAEGADAMLIMAPELMKNDKCCLAHWTGQELVVLELSARQQRAFGIEPGTMIQELGQQHEPVELPTIERVNLADVRIDDCRHFDVRQRMTGHFTFETNEPASIPVSGCALRVKYFRPRMRCRVTGFSHGDLVLPRGELPFSFDPLVSANDPDPSRGPLVLFFQLVTSRNWTVPTAGRKISNILARVVEIGPRAQIRGS